MTLIVSHLRMLFTSFRVLTTQDLFKYMSSNLVYPLVEGFYSTTMLDYVLRDGSFTIAEQLMCYITLNPFTIFAISIFMLKLN